MRLAYLGIEADELGKHALVHPRYRARVGLQELELVAASGGALVAAPITVALVVVRRQEGSARLI